MVLENMGRCIGPDCAKFKKEKIDGCSHEGMQLITHTNY